MMGSYEEYLLVKLNVMRYTKEEVDAMPMWKFNHIKGFALAEQQEREDERKRQEQHQAFQTFYRDSRSRPPQRSISPSEVKNDGR